MKKKAVVTITAAAMAFGIVAGASAAPVLEKISAQLNWSIKFQVNGKEWKAQDSAGNKLAPIIYGGTTYLPVRAVADALGTAVEYDSKNDTIYLGEKSSTTPITSEKIKLSYSSMSTKDKQYTVQGGVDYGSGIVFDELNSAAKSFELQPENKYQKLDLKVFVLDIEGEIEVKVYDDSDTVLKHVTLSSQDKIQDISVDIGGSKSIRIEGKTPVFDKGKIFVTGNYR
ncbi:copper amine oxidase N-terminal domain-containing protein [Paenibacillus thiaminolyticus]|uniref:Copper amine oxidase n=1 Tax=Paenibacillus thiaminolyticus TaxID=49283 RepID=A0AAP9E053_PANTH|nr:stalk domain-containing protein [Paenibacillus thiaminolyticus]MCY9534657.1 copper amine oxidase N-terminal domain-containing protein [Paenibacillus thiaminolyticus]MCY9603307.1 copper amine oxidase N-terminal domain-containing protein [Paenibacillus thiaminolyticus]MCY9609979.1 copper amine oxidase N-terminal domain-containing protein [Paenibacillus thiaminolyticus]MCY9615493.1 copper amine oxidase N-terminal domain-containing protein [Paenibacillus thiaminolyticus]MCY9617160.1 copper amin